MLFGVYVFALNVDVSPGAGATGSLWIASTRGEFKRL
jgi:hypothetical protein